MSRKSLIILASSGSAALLLGAFAFQYLGGMAPCKLCLWQRWPHGVAALIGLLALTVAPRGPFLPLLGGFAALATGAVGLYHTGVERNWWEGPTGCTGFDISDLSAAELMEAITDAPLIRCDEVAWALAGVSMASWNGILSVGLALIWIAAARARD